MKQIFLRYVTILRRFECCELHGNNAYPSLAGATGYMIGFYGTIGLVSTKQKICRSHGVPFAPSCKCRDGVAPWRVSTDTSLWRVPVLGVLLDCYQIACFAEELPARTALLRPCRSTLDFHRDCSRHPDGCLAVLRPIILDVITLMLIRSNIGYVL
jgi:hypothetical protein